MTSDYPRYPDVYDVNESIDRSEQSILDVSHYMNISPYIVYPETPVREVFQLFRSMGLRHLPVVTHDGQIAGMITRHNLTHDFLEARLECHDREMT